MEEGQEVRWDGLELEGMVEEVFKTVTTSLPTDITLVTENGERYGSINYPWALMV